MALPPFQCWQVGSLFVKASFSNCNIIMDVYNYTVAPDLTGALHFNRHEQKPSSSEQSHYQFV